MISTMNARYNETKPVVWVIDREQWPRANLRALLLDRGFDAVGFEEIAGALAALKDIHEPKPCIIVLELHALPPPEEELDALVRLSVPVVAIARAVEMNQDWIGKVKWVALIQRPVTIGQIADTVEKLMTDRATGPV